MTIKVAILNVGQGDTIVVTRECEGTTEAVIIDCIDARKVRDYLNLCGVKIIHSVVVTHLHSDHYRQVRTLLEQCPAWFPSSAPLLVYRSIPENRREFILGDDKNARELYDCLHRWARANIERVYTATSQADPYSQTKWEKIIHILYPSDPHFAEALDGCDYNDTSVLMKIAGDGSTLLLTGDLQEAGFTRYLKHGKEKVRSDFLKAPHHGAWRDINGNHADFGKALDAIQPVGVIIIARRIEGFAVPRPSVEADCKICLVLHCT